MALIVTTWHWGNKYPQDYVDRLRAGVARHMAQPYEFRVLHPELDDRHLTEVPGCFVRLRMFDRGWQQRQAFHQGDRVVCIDLDAVVTGPLDDLFYRAEEFCCLEGANASNPCRYNGSIFMLRAGYRHDVWDEFSLEAAAKVPFFEFPDDQAWLAHKFPNGAGWKVGPQSGIYAFKKPAWPKGDDLPSDAKLVVFPGWRDPAKFSHLSWVNRHWMAA